MKVAEMAFFPVFVVHCLINDKLVLLSFIHIVSCKTNGGNVENQPCVFPFIYKGDSYQACTTKDHDVPWCYTEVNSNGAGVEGRWGNCGPGCNGILIHINRK